MFASVLTLQLSIKKFSKGLTSFVFLSVSGLALCQVIFVYSLSNNSQGDVVFLENYYKLAQPLQSLYYMLFAICTVSVFDRFALFLILTSICAMINKYTPSCLLGSSTEQMHDNLESLFYMIKKKNVVKGYVISAAVLQ